MQFDQYDTLFSWSGIIDPTQVWKSLINLLFSHEIVIL